MSRRTRAWFFTRLRPSRGAGVLLGCALIVANGAIATVVLRGLGEANAWVEHTQQVLIALYDVRGAARDAETGQRAFMITGGGQFQDAYAHAVESTDVAVEQLRGLIADNPAQQQRLTHLQAAIREDQAVMATAMTDRDAAAAPPLVTSGELAPLLRTARDVQSEITLMQAAERELFAERRSAANRRAVAAEFPMILGTVGGIALIALIYRLMSTESATRAQHVRDRTLELGHAISALRQRGAELRSREEQLRILIASTPAAIAMFDRDMRFMAASERFRVDYRLGEQRLIGRDFYAVFPETPQHWRDAHARCLAGATEREAEEQFNRADGTTDWVRWEVRPWFNGDGEVGGLALFSEVITVGKQTEEALAESTAQLRQAQKMEVIGQLTGGIAHDFNNMLGIIIGNVEFLQDAVKGNPQQEELAAEILNVSLSGAAMTRRLLAFARKQTLKPETIDLREYLPGLHALLARTLGDRIRVSFEVNEELWLTQADPGQVGEALLNLAINARDAMPHGGQLTIAAANARLTDPAAASDAQVTPGDYILLSVTDTGEGMPPAVVERAMEPFFTTKETGKGTGLGLSMVYGFTKQSGGHLKIYSEVGVGTTIRLYLPRVAGQAERQSPAATPAPLPGGAASVLVVDDNAQMAELARRHLTSLGYDVTVVHSGPEALSQLDSSRNFELLFSDVVMPDGISGYELATIATRKYPGLKVLLASGYAGPVGRSNGAAEPQPDFPMLQKPYRRPELALRVRAVLDGA